MLVILVSVKPRFSLHDLFQNRQESRLLIYNKQAGLCTPPPPKKRNLLVYYVRCIDQFNFNSSIYDHMWCQQCRYRTSSVGCWWICHLMIHRYLRCSLLHSHVGGMGQLWMTPLGSVIFLPRLATSITSHLVLSALKGVCAQRDGSVDALSLCPE